MNVKYTEQPSGNFAVITHPLDDPLHRAAWEALQFIDDQTPDCICKQGQEGKECHRQCKAYQIDRSKVATSLEAALATLGVTAEAIARYEEA